MSSDVRVNIKLEKFHGRGPSKKIFKPRNSLLTDALHDKHISGIYNLCVAGSIVLVLVNVLYEWRDTRWITFGTGNLLQYINKIEIGLLAWTCNFLLTFLNFLVFKIWATIHKRTKFKKVTGTCFILLHIIYQVGIQSIAIYACFVYNLSAVVTFALLLETLRLGMKCYAYVRSNAGQVITAKEYISPSWRHFVYFMFCPTMLYRDSYPRTDKRSWKLVAKYLLECISTLYIVSLMNTIFLQRKFMDYGKTEVTLFSIVILWMEITPTVTILFYFFAFYGLHHAWMNMFAEVLQFADRGFYKDWWNSTSFREHYRRWGVIVHEWLYEYMYMDLYRVTKSIIVSSLITIIMSAVVHEYVLIVTFRFFTPAILVVYGIVGILYMYVPLTKQLGNIFFWFNLIIGLPLMVLVYIMEYYARINCPASETMNTTIAYYYTPMIFNCNNIIV